MNIDDCLLVGVDTETSGIPTEGELNTHDLLEVAVRFVDLAHPRAICTLDTLVAPSSPIPPTASAIHHMIAEDFAGAPSRATVLRLLDRIIPSDAVIFAHNAPFDRAFMPDLGDRRWLCTRRLALHVWPEAPSFSNQSLRYWRGYGHRFGADVHRAAVDIEVTEALLRDALECIRLDRPRDIDDLIAWVNSPALLVRMPFGKHHGSRFDLIHEQAPDYLEWITRQRGIDADVLYTARVTLGYLKKT